MPAIKRHTGTGSNLNTLGEIRHAVKQNSCLISPKICHFSSWIWGKVSVKLLQTSQVWNCLTSWPQPGDSSVYCSRLVDGSTAAVKWTNAALASLAHLLCTSKKKTRADLYEDLTRPLRYATLKCKMTYVHNVHCCRDYCTYIIDNTLELVKSSEHENWAFVNKLTKTFRKYWIWVHSPQSVHSFNSGRIIVTLVTASLSSQDISCKMQVILSWLDMRGDRGSSYSIMHW